MNECDISNSLHSSLSPNQSFTTYFIKMVKCAVPTCQSDSRKHNKKNDNITFHRFPKNPEIANKWVKAIRKLNWEPNNGSYVCSLHFNSAFISETKQGYRLLVSGAIPELHIPDIDPSDPLYGVPSHNESMIPVDKDCTLKYEDNKRTAQLKDETDEKESPSSSKMVLVRDCLLEPSYTPRERELKREILHLRDVAKRRRLRCNALYSEITRFKRKISRLNQLLIELRKKDPVTQEQKSVKIEINLVTQEQKNVKNEQALETQDQLLVNLKKEQDLTQECNSTKRE